MVELLLDNMYVAEERIVFVQDALHLMEEMLLCLEVLPFRHQSRPNNSFFVAWEMPVIQGKMVSKILGMNITIPLNVGMHNLNSAVVCQQHWIYCRSCCCHEYIFLTTVAEIIDHSRYKS